MADGLVLVSHHTRDGLHLKRIGVAWFYGR